MSCTCGINHTIFLSDDCVVHSFGQNDFGKLGFEHISNVTVPLPITNLPKINQVSCGANFTICIDVEGFIWAFGINFRGQLGTGNTICLNTTQKIQNIPPVRYVDCGSSHTLIITNDSNLWSFGANSDGELCHGDTEDRSKPQKTSFSKISKISTGNFRSLFQNDKGEIFLCGCNFYGACGLGFFNASQITPSLIPNLPPTLVTSTNKLNNDYYK